MLNILLIAVIITTNQPILMVSCSPRNKTLGISSPAVYPGDSIAISFDLNTTTGAWNDVWAITPGSTGKNAGEKFSVHDIIVPENATGVLPVPSRILY